MRRMYGYDDILVMPDDLRAFAWSAPMRDLAAQIGMSDVGLKKLLSSYEIAPPPQGYWNKVHAGKPVPACPKAAPRKPGETGRLRVDRRFSKVLSPAPPMSSAGPFATRFVPEDLEELRRLETAAIRRATVPKSLDGAHGGLRQLLKKEESRREKVAASSWHWDAPKFDNPVAKRRLRILNGIFLALSKRGHDSEAYEQDGEIHARAFVGDTAVGIDVRVHGNHRTVRVNGYLRPAPDLPLSTPLEVRVSSSYDGKQFECWHDDKQGKLEEKLVPIVAGVIVAGEDRFRRSLREAEERIERERIAAEKRRQEELAALNRDRVANLFKSGELLRQAQDIRALVSRVRDAVVASAQISADDLALWERWALDEADKIDPVNSGQFKTHFIPPKLGD